MNELYDLPTTEEKLSCGGAKPLPLRTNWMLRDREPAPKKEPVYWFFLDDLRGLTVARTKTLEDAYACMDSLDFRTVIRPEVIDEESLAADSRLRKFKSQYGV